MHGLEVERSGKYLVHCHYLHKPYCVFVDVATNASEVAVWFGKYKYHTTVTNLHDAYESGIDQHALVTFSVGTAFPTPHHEKLLDLQAF